VDDEPVLPTGLAALVTDEAQLSPDRGVHEPLRRLGPPVPHGEDLDRRLPGPVPTNGAFAGRKIGCTPPPDLEWSVGLGSELHEQGLVAPPDHRHRAPVLKSIS
jgi:hypothetical protein